MQERSKNKQLAINMTASLLTFVVGLGIQFFLTPYIVKSLGADAYGFIGLSSNILSYTGLVTIALNSMAGRFVTIKYQEGDIEEANKYYASVFYSNIILASVILLLGAGCVIWLEQMINIPNHLLVDVKILFSLLVVNNIVGLVTGIWGVATFIKNRLDLSNIRSIIGNLMNVTILIVSFTFFTPHIWYMGIAGMVLTLYVAITNRQFSRILTPELIVRRCNYDWNKVLELVKSGMWNVVSKLGEMLGQGFDMLIANLFIGATAMGVFGLSRQIPFITIGLCATISGVFSPTFTRLYALKDTEQLKNELNKSIRILGCVVTIPLVFLLVFGDNFYHLWLPTQDYHKIQLLSILCSLELVLSLPLEALWNIFTITNKVRTSSLFMLGNHFLTFVIVITSMNFIDSVDIKLMVLASTRTILGIIRSLTFLPMYGAKCLNLRWNSFFPPMAKSFCALVATGIICFALKTLFSIDNWTILIFCGVMVAIVSCAVNFYLVFSSTDRHFILSKIQTTLIRNERR